MYKQGNIEIEWLKHAGFKIKTPEGVIYIDPYLISVELEKADVILLTHTHYDHLDEPSLKQLIKPETTIFCSEDCVDLLMPWAKVKSLQPMLPKEEKVFGHLKIQATPAYNIEKPFHPQEKHWLGFILEIEGYRLYFLGDTDVLEDMEHVQCDFAFFPVSGIYMMNAHEAALLAQKMKPKIMSFPMHWGCIVDDQNRKVGTKEDAETFCKEASVPCTILKPIA